MSNQKTCAPEYRRNCAACIPKNVDFPEPIGPSTSCIPTSPTHGVKKKGVLPEVAVSMRAGESGEKYGFGTVGCPAQMLVSGKRSARLSEWIGTV